MSVDPNRELYTASKQGNVSKVVALMKSGADALSYRDDKGRNSVHVAAVSGRAGVLRVFSQHAVSFEGRDHETGCTPLMLAVQAGSSPSVEVLLVNPASVNAVDDKDGYSAMHFAASLGRADIIEQLCGAGAKVDVRDTAARRTWHEERDGVMSRLTQFGNVLGIGAPPEELVGAAMGGTTPIGTTPIQLAIKQAAYPCVEVMLRMGADPNQDVTSESKLLEYAIDCKSEGSAVALVNHGVQLVTSRGISLLRQAVRANMPELVKALLKKGEHLNTKDELGFAPIHSIPSATGDPLALLQVLLDAKVDLDCRTPDGQSVLHLAAHRGSVQLIQLLIANHASVASRDNTGATAEAIATRERHTLAAALLKHAKQSIDAEQASSTSAAADAVRTFPGATAAVGAPTALGAQGGNMAALLATGMPPSLASMLAGIGGGILSGAGFQFAAPHGDGCECQCGGHDDLDEDGECDCPECSGMRDDEDDEDEDEDGDGRCACGAYHDDRDGPASAPSGMHSGGILFSSLFPAAATSTGRSAGQPPAPAPATAAAASASAASGASGGKRTRREVAAAAPAPAPAAASTRSGSASGSAASAGSGRGGKAKRGRGGGK